MEANEVHELHEHHEEAEKHPSLRPVTFTMSLLAVLVAVCTVLGHRTHTEAVLAQAKASDLWNEYQAKKIRQNETQLTRDLLLTLAAKDEGAQKLMESYKEHSAKWDEDLKEEQEKAQDFEADVRRAEHRADRFDFGEALLEIGLVITSITLLTHLRLYWFAGMVFGLAGIAVCAAAFFR